MHDHGLITSPAALAALSDLFSSREWVAIDTEFMREKTYFPQLCLVQLASTTDLACIDPLALSDLGPLLDLLRNPRLLKVFHAAGQDLEVLRLVTGSVPAPIFDTQVAAGLLGHGDQVGYANLVETLLQVDLAKSETRTNWSRRPLSPEQLRYAKDDVRFLAALYQRLEQELQEQGRLAWVAPEMALLVTAAATDADPGSLWRRVSGHRRLKPRELAILRELAAWREVVAREKDRPRRWILSDDALLQLARSAPSTREDLRKIALTLAEIQLDSLLSALQKGRQCPESAWPRSAEKLTALSEAEEALVDVAEALLRDLAHKHTVNPATIASRKDLVRLLRTPEDSPLSRGWRYTVAGHCLSRWFSGELELGLQEGLLAYHEKTAHAASEQPPG